MQINYPNSGNGSYLFSENRILHNIAGLNKIRFNLKGEHEAIINITKQVRDNVKQLQEMKDTGTVIIIKLNKENDYEDYIRLLDICLYERVKRYCICKDSLIIWGYTGPVKHDDSETLKPLYL